MDKETEVLLRGMYFLIDLAADHGKCPCIGKGAYCKNGVHASFCTYGQAMRLLIDIKDLHPNRLHQEVGDERCPKCGAKIFINHDKTDWACFDLRCEHAHGHQS